MLFNGAFYNQIFWIHVLFTGLFPVFFFFFGNHTGHVGLLWLAGSHMDAKKHT